MKVQQTPAHVPHNQIRQHTNRRPRRSCQRHIASAHPAHNSTRKQFRDSKSKRARLRFCGAFYTPQWRCRALGMAEAELGHSRWE